MKTFHKVLLLSIYLISQVCSAAPIPELMSFLEREIQQMDRAVSACHMTHSKGISQENEAWLYQNFWIRLRGRAGFEIPGFAKVELVPEVELFWQRGIPQGWESYKPVVLQHQF